MHCFKSFRNAPRIGRKVLLLPLLALIPIQLGSPATAQSGGGRDDAGARAEVLALDERRARAFVEADLDLFDRITAANYTHVETSGLARTKADFMAFLRAGEVRFLSFDIDANEARIFGDVAVLTGTYTNQIETAAGPQPVKRARHQRVYVRREGVWQVVAHQATEIMPDSH